MHVKDKRRVGSINNGITKLIVVLHFKSCKNIIASFSTIAKTINSVVIHC